VYHFEIFVYFSCFWVNYHKKGGYPPQKVTFGGVRPPLRGGGRPPRGVPPPKRGGYPPLRGGVRPPPKPPKSAKKRQKHAKTQKSWFWWEKCLRKAQFSCFSTLGGVVWTPPKISIWLPLTPPNLALFGFLGSNLTPRGGFGPPRGGGRPPQKSLLGGPTPPFGGHLPIEGGSKTPQKRHF